MGAPNRPQFSEEEIQDWMRVAHAAAELAYSPYSRIKVGAALVGHDGAVYSGCNVENASYGLTICAERNALFRAVASGERRFRAVAIATDRAGALFPCGACRQVLAEFAPELPVFTQGRSSEIARSTLAELLPNAFLPKDLR
jgi:cytidine deaminase